MTSNKPKFKVGDVVVLNSRFDHEQLAPHVPGDIGVVESTEGFGPAWVDVRVIRTGIVSTWSVRAWDPVDPLT